MHNRLKKETDRQRKEGKKGHHCSNHKRRSQPTATAIRNVLADNCDIELVACAGEGRPIVELALRGSEVPGFREKKNYTLTRHVSTAVVHSR